MVIDNDKSVNNYVIDIETDGIDATKIHCMCVAKDNDWTATFVTYADMKVFLANLNKNDRIIGHNFVRYDAPVIERILDVKIPCQIVDTLAISWYLYPDLQKHGLEAWGERLGIAKPKVDDWENADLQVYVDRCEEDVKINLQLWNKQIRYLGHIYSGKYQNLLKYLTFKMHCAMLAEKSGWDLDVAKAEQLKDSLEEKIKEANDKLRKVMPPVIKYAERTKPAKCYKKNGELSAAGIKWLMLTEDHDKPFDYKGIIKEEVKKQEPNPNSVMQIKEWLFSNGWKPARYDYNNREYADGREVPQIRGFDGNICKSVKALADKIPEVMELENLSIYNHRLSVVNNLLKPVREKHCNPKAEMRGLTNTLRLKHTVIVNIPSLRKPFGKEIRELLTSSIGNLLCGSDMCSLEDRTKQHFMWDYDPDFVEDMMSEDFDPHLDLALSAKAVTPDQVAAYKAGDKDSEVTAIRHAYKGGNYACTYGAGVKTLARQLGCTESEAAKIHRAYWKRNWSLKKLSEDLKVKVIHEQMWLYNPVSKLYYHLKAEKDKFSTLNQGTATYCFDMWLGFILKKRPQLTGQFHDELILNIKQDEKENVEHIIKTSVQSVNKVLNLNRDLDCDVQFGTDYSQIH